MSSIPDGVYSIELPFDGGAITDTGEGRYLNLLPPGSLGPKAHLIKITTSPEGSKFQFTDSKKYITYNDEPRMNNKLTTSEKPSYFKIQSHDYTEGQYAIFVANDKTFSVAAALERIYPPWVAMVSFPEAQAWVIEKAPTAKL